MPDAIEAAIHKTAGNLVDRKPHSIAVHYRNNPDSAEQLSAIRGRLIAGTTGNFVLRRGQMVFETLPAVISKGSALERIMLEPAFFVWRPLMIGDVEPGIAAFAAAELGGIGLKVAGEHFADAEADLAGPREVRAWLASLLGWGGWPQKG